MFGKLVVLICGGGNGVYCLVGFFVMRFKIESCVLIFYFDEVERWVVELDFGLFIIVWNDDGSKSFIKIKLFMVIKDFLKVVFGVNYIFFVVFVFVYV